MEAYDDYLELSVGSLKDYLNIRGPQTTGRKVELVQGHLQHVSRIYLSSSPMRNTVSV